MAILNLFRNSTSAGNLCVGSVLESSCTHMYTPVLCSETPVNSLPEASFEKGLLKAKAKINLFFHITGKKEDGYHLIDSLVVFAEDIYDLIEIKEGKNKSTIDGEFAHLLASENNNLIDKALQIFSPGKEYHYKLNKNIPIGAGLGGGSSDAAMVAKYLIDRSSSLTSTEGAEIGDLVRTALEIPGQASLARDDVNDLQKLTSLGADLPICYHAQSAFCSGIGEAIEPIDNFPIIYLVLVYPNKSLLTKDIFMLNKNINSPKINHPNFKDADQLIEFLSSLKNDLTDAATQLLPEVKSILDLIMAQEGCKLSRMSGSGSTCFGIFTDKVQAIEASKNIAALKPEYWVKYTIVK